MAKKIKFTPFQKVYVFGSLKRGLRKEYDVECVTHLDVARAAIEKFGLNATSTSKKEAYRVVLYVYYYGSNIELRDFVERYGQGRKKYLDKQPKEPKQIIVIENPKPSTSVKQGNDKNVHKRGRLKPKEKPIMLAIKRGMNAEHGIKDTTNFVLAQKCNEIFGLGLTLTGKKSAYQIVDIYKNNTHQKFTEFVERNSKKATKAQIRGRRLAYITYLESQQWRAKRNELFAVRGKKCEDCGATQRLHVHHLTYKNLFNEPLEDLQVLCHSCHKKRHPHMK